jgi:RNA polymerase sigma-70 factor (ECF subfamily)
MDRDRELRLVNGLRQGDAAAFDAVHDAFHARLYNFLARLSNSRDLAEDLLEETWLRLVVHARRLHPDTRIGPWLFTVARRLYIGHRRSRLVEEEYAPVLLNLWPAGSATQTPLQTAEDHEARQRLSRAVAELPTIYREALLLTMEDLGPAEAAAVCGITPEAMRQRLSRARTMLMQRLSDDAQPSLGALREATS